MYIYSPLSLASSLESRARRRVNGIARLNSMAMARRCRKKRGGATIYKKVIVCAQSLEPLPQCYHSTKQSYGRVIISSTPAPT